MFVHQNQCLKLFVPNLFSFHCWFHRFQFHSTIVGLLYHAHLCKTGENNGFLCCCQQHYQISTYLKWLCKSKVNVLLVSVASPVNLIKRGLEVKRVDKRWTKYGKLTSLCDNLKLIGKYIDANITHPYIHLSILYLFRGGRGGTSLSR